MKKAAKGRPRKKFGHKSAQISFHVEPKAKERYQQAATAAELDFSDWLRQVVEDAARRQLGLSDGD